MEQTFSAATPEDFKPVIAAILEQSADGNAPLLITLQGDLGAGKTTFTQQLAKALGVTEPVTSPTFTIMKQYALEHERFDTLIHIDAYRFESEEEAAPLRLIELFSQPRTIICLEWPEQIPSLIPESAVRVVMEAGADEVRIVRVEFSTEK